MSDRQVTHGDKPMLRGDARRNLEKLKVAAVEVFRERGLGAPLEAIAERAGVSVGTLYNRFGDREALIDAVIPALAAAQFRLVVERASAGDSPWVRFATYVEQICELQANDPILNDAVSDRFLEAEQLKAVCDEAFAYAGQLIEAAQRDGSLRSDFTTRDLYSVFLSSSALVRASASAGRDAWRRQLVFILDGLRTWAADQPHLPSDARQESTGMLSATGVTRKPCHG
jgi:AcrR family transcriptional regulator